MKSKNIILLYITLLLFSTNAIIAQEKTCIINVEVIGLKNTQGQIMISITKGPEGWPDEKFIEQRFIQKFTAPKFIVKFKDIPYGNYAIGVLHDKDNNGEMTKNFIGMPKESFGFSKDYKVVFRAPKYEEANFNIDEPIKNITINLQH